MKNRIKVWTACAGLVLAGLAETAALAAAFSRLEDGWIWSTVGYSVVSLFAFWVIAYCWMIVVDDI